LDFLNIFFKLFRFKPKQLLVALLLKPTIPSDLQSWSWCGSSEVAVQNITDLQSPQTCNRGPGVVQVRSRSRTSQTYNPLRPTIAVLVWFKRGRSPKHHFQALQVIIYFKLYLFYSFYFCSNLKYLLICNSLLFKMLFQNNYFMTNKLKLLFELFKHFLKII
jgi:hypothetical protein